MKRRVAKVLQAVLFAAAINSSQIVVEARKQKAAPVEQQQEPEPEPAFQAPQSHGSKRGHGQQASPEPEVQPEKESASPKGKDDGADQDEENDPKWYKVHATTYPCYKLAEQGLFNFEQMRNLDGDWEVTDTRGHLISFNFCVYSSASNEGCKNDAFAYMHDGSACKALTSDEPGAEFNEYVERPSTIESQIKKGEDQEGIRITRAGGAECTQDPGNLMSVTIDVWCNPAITNEPVQIKSASHGPLDDDEADPCNIYISMEHANGCAILDLQPFTAVLGVFMMMSGICLQYMGPKWQQKFMVFIVRLGTFLIICSFAYDRNYFAFVDPSEPEKKKDPIKFFIALIFALIAQWIVGYLFRYSMRLAPTLLGIYMGYYFSSYIILSINGLGGMFESAKTAKDTVDPMMSIIYEVLGSLFGGTLGYCYSYAFIAVVQTFLSAYLIVRGSTMFKNMGFPNEIVLLSSTTQEHDGLVKLPPAFYAYSFAIFVLWILFLRSHMRRAREEPNQKYLDEEV